MMELRRSEFLICAVGSNSVRSQALLESLENSGYKVVLKTDFESLIDMLRIEPPHFVMFDFDDSEPDLISWTTQIKKVSSEIKIVLLVPLAKRLQAIHCKQIKIVDDYVLSPWMSDGEVIDTFDRCALIASYQFENEHLKDLLHSAKDDANTKAETPTNELERSKIGLKGLQFLEDEKQGLSTTENIATELIEEMEFCQNSDHVIDRFLAHASPTPCLFLRYISPRRHLVAQSTQGLIRSSTRGLGVEISVSSEEILKGSSIEIPELNELLRMGLGWDQFGARVLMLNQGIEGVFVCEDKTQMPSELVWQIFRQALAGQRASDQMKKWILKDEDTGFWTASFLHECLMSEVSRARRIHLPVSFLVIELDQQAASARKRIAKALEKTSRVNDVLISLPKFQFAVVLPHTPLEGAATKAERFRRIVEAMGHGSTVSIGVSEYPRCAADGESLLQSADDALSTVRELGRNKVCIAMETPDLRTDLLVNP